MTPKDRDAATRAAAYIARLADDLEHLVGELAESSLCLLDAVAPPRQAPRRLGPTRTTPRKPQLGQFKKPRRPLGEFRKPARSQALTGALTESRHLMARTNVPITKLKANGGTAPPTSTTADPTNGHTITTAPHSTEHLIVELTNSSGATRTATFKAAPAPPGYADVTVTVPAGATQIVAGINSARCGQQGGDLFLDLEAGWTGTVVAMARPRVA